MKDTLNRVRGAVARKELVPVLTHFCVQHGAIQGSNGYVSIGAPCPELELEFTVPAVAFLKAVDACDGEPSFKMLDSGKLLVQAGKFRARLPVAEVDAYPQADHLSGHVRPAPGLVDALRNIRPFVGTDAFRGWSHGVRVGDGFIWATNNVVLARTPFAYQGPPVVWPSALVDELLRLNEQPTAYAHTETHAEFQYADGSWVLGTLVNLAWPDVHQFFAEPWPPLEGPDLAQLLAAVESVAPFCPDQPVVKLTTTGVETEDGQTHAVMEIAGLGPATLRLEPFTRVLQAAEALDLTSSPYRWTGSGMEGVLIGQRDQGTP